MSCCAICPTSVSPSESRSAGSLFRVPGPISAAARPAARCGGLCDLGEDFVIEYRHADNSWGPVATCLGSGIKGEIIQGVMRLPSDAKHGSLAIRARQTNGSGPTYDYWHVDDVCFVQAPVPALLVSKFSQTLSDPFNGGSNPKAIPGATVLYTVNVTNQGSGAVDANSLVVTDPVPANTALYVTTSGGPPVVFVNGPVASGLTYTYASNVTFSNQPGGIAPYNYTPVPDPQGFDPAFTGLRVALGGSMNAAAGGNTPSFNLLLRLRIQ